MKRFIKKSICLLLALMLVIGTGSAAVQAETLSVTEVKQTTVLGSSSGTTIKVTKADESTAKKLHEKLLKGKKITLKVKGSKSAAKKLIKNLQKKIQKVNGQAVLFQYDLDKKSGSYYLATISADNAKLYKYSIKFIKKLYTNVKTKLLESETYANYLKDCETYPDEHERNLHLLYDFFAGSTVSSHKSGSGKVKMYTMIGGDAATTVSRTNLHSDWRAENEKLMLSLVTKSKKKTDEQWLGVNVTYTYECEMRSYEEFAAQPRVDKMLERFSIDGWYSTGYAESKIAASRGMSDLSDAMKIWVIDQSNYFGCRFTRSMYGMLYKNNVFFAKAGWKGMKTLYENKAEGVCQAYASYESLVFRQIGITTYLCRSGKINHAWTVVKVKNSDGKTLWIPFDYGIGPANGLSLTADQRKYVDTQAKQYKLYLSGIKGAPTKKNFVGSDFN
jgi:hypothetical protein